MTNRDFPNQYYRPDPNAPSPYYDPNIYNIPNYENVPTSFATGNNLQAPSVGLAPTGYTQSPGTYVNDQAYDPSVYATGYGGVYGTGYVAPGNVYNPGYTSYPSYNGLYLK